MNGIETELNYVNLSKVRKQFNELSQTYFYFFILLMFVLCMTQLHFNKHILKSPCTTSPSNDCLVHITKGTEGTVNFAYIYDIDDTVDVKFSYTQI